MSDSAARTIAAAIVLASVVAAVGIALTERQHRESLIWDCVQQHRKPWVITSDGEVEAFDTPMLHRCRVTIRQVAK